MRLLMRLTPEACARVQTSISTLFGDQQDEEYERSHADGIAWFDNEFGYTTASGKGEYHFVNPDARLLEFKGRRGSLAIGTGIFIIRKEDVEEIVEMDSTEPWIDPFDEKANDHFVAPEEDVEKARDHVKMVTGCDDGFFTYLATARKLQLHGRVTNKSVHRALSCPDEILVALHETYTRWD